MEVNFTKNSGVHLTYTLVWGTKIRGKAVWKILMIYVLSQNSHDYKDGWSFGVVVETKGGRADGKKFPDH